MFNIENISRGLKDFLKSHLELIDNYNFDALYNEALMDYRYDRHLYELDDYPLHLNKVLETIGIDPTPYFTNIPHNYKSQYLDEDFTISLSSKTQQVLSFAFESSAITKFDASKAPLTHIGDYAFDNAIILTEVILPNTLLSLGNYVFHDCKRLQAINYLGTKEEWTKIKINAYKNEFINSLIIKCLDGDLNI